MADTLRGRRLRYAQAILGSRRGGGALLGEAALVDGARVLVLGEAPSETLCALIHTECRTADARLPDAPVEPGSADLVLVPHPSFCTLGRIAVQASRALQAGGRLVMAIPPERDFALLASRTLREAGFAEPLGYRENGRELLQARRARDAGQHSSSYRPFTQFWNGSA